MNYHWITIDDKTFSAPPLPINVESREKFLNFISNFLGDNKNPIFCEIGVFRGDFSQMILDIINPKFLLLVDPFRQGEKTYGKELNNLPTSYSDEKDYAEVLNRFSKQVVSGQVGISPNYSFEAVKEWPSESFDVIYHDGSHLYEDVKRDMNEWLPKLKPGGLIAGHDYTDHPGFGVKKAVDEFCQENNFQMILLNENGGDYALIRRK